MATFKKLCLRTCPQPTPQVGRETPCGRTGVQPHACPRDLQTLLWSAALFHHFEDWGQAGPPARTPPLPSVSASGAPPVAVPIFVHSPVPIVAQLIAWASLCAGLASLPSAPSDTVASELLTEPPAQVVCSAASTQKTPHGGVWGHSPRARKFLGNSLRWRSFLGSSGPWGPMPVWVGGDPLLLGVGLCRQMSAKDCCWIEKS